MREEFQFLTDDSGVVIGFQGFGSGKMMFIASPRYLEGKLERKRRRGEIKRNRVTLGVLLYVVMCELGLGYKF